MYGTTLLGGSSSNGTVFCVKTDGTGFKNLHSFTALDETYGTNTDGANPIGGLVLSGNTLYGTTWLGGSSGSGTVFQVSIDGTGFTNLHSFAGTDGACPPARLLLSGNTLYGTTAFGGTSGAGVVFAINRDGTSLITLHSFTALDPTYATNSDGAHPYCELILSGDTLYGTTYQGGPASLGYYGVGTVFAVNTDGTGFTNRHSLAGYLDGAYPYQARLLLSGNILYGTTSGGGNQGWGVLFAVNTNGTGFVNLHNFLSYVAGGQTPMGGLVSSGGTLFGTTTGGGWEDFGTVFQVKANGTGITNLHNFTYLGGLGTNLDGACPHGALVLWRNTLYGTASGGGSSGNGTIFSIFIPPKLTITPTGASVILTWPTNYDGFTLQSTTNLASPAAWTTNLPAPVVVNGQNTVTNPISGTQQFYRLSQ